MFADVLAPCVTRSSAAMVLTEEYMGPCHLSGRSSMPCTRSVSRKLPQKKKKKKKSAHNGIISDKKLHYIS